mmetsp:Transcript_37939/g.95262  ORF Transcript_37939/g.95262 Transcript_37939/m.95262 type:complete len:415 (+) Transcript_37939:85-1329(+)
MHFFGLRLLEATDMPYTANVPPSSSATFKINAGTKNRLRNPCPHLLERLCQWDLEASDVSAAIDVARTVRAYMSLRTSFAFAFDIGSCGPTAPQSFLTCRGLPAFVAAGTAKRDAEVDIDVLKEDAAVLARSVASNESQAPADSTIRVGDGVSVEATVCPVDSRGCRNLPHEGSKSMPQMLALRSLADAGNSVCACEGSCVPKTSDNRGDCFDLLALKVVAGCVAGQAPDGLCSCKVGCFRSGLWGSPPLLTVDANFFACGRTMWPLVLCEPGFGGSTPQLGVSGEGATSVEWLDCGPLRNNGLEALVGWPCARLMVTSWPLALLAVEAHTAALPFGRSVGVSTTPILLPADRIDPTVGPEQVFTDFLKIPCAAVGACPARNLHARLDCSNAGGKQSCSLSDSDCEGVGERSNS